jgi:hypothetical protein
MLRCLGEGNAHLEEIDGPDLDGDGIPDLVIAARNIGSSGQDGVEVDIRPPRHGARRRWGNGHVTLMKFTDDDGESMRILHTQNPASAGTELLPDTSGLGGPPCRVECRDAFGNVLLVRLLPPGEPVFISSTLNMMNSEDGFESDTPSARSRYGIRWYEARTCSFASGDAADGVYELHISPEGGAPFESLASMSLTSPDGQDIIFGGITLTDPPAPPCDPDFNQDGNVDQDDVVYLINVVGGGDNPTGIDPDFNQDGNADQDDVVALIDVVAGGPCP